MAPNSISSPTNSSRQTTTREHKPDSPVTDLDVLTVGRVSVDLYARESGPLTVNDCFRPVVRYCITTPEQVVQSLPHALQTMLDPGDCGPAFIGLPQDIQAEAYDFPVRFFDETEHEIRRPRPDRRELERAGELLARAAKPMLIAGGGVHWSGAEAELRQFAEKHNIPVVETVAGRTCLASSHPLNAGPIGVTGCTSANALAAEADVVLAVGTRLQDFVTGSWTVFRNENVRIIGVNTARFDATKHIAVPVIGDAKEVLAELTAAIGDYCSPDSWSATCASETAQYHAYIDKIAARGTDGETPTYAQVVGVVDRAADASTYALTAAGGFPGELVNGWRSDTVHSFDTEYGYSCMGYEISGGWGAKMAMPDREVVVFVGDGSYLMMNSDLYSSVLSGHKLIVIVCDNGGFAVINRLQVNQGGVPFQQPDRRFPDRRRGSGRLCCSRRRDGLSERDGLDRVRTRSRVRAGQSRRSHLCHCAGNTGP